MKKMNESVAYFDEGNAMLLAHVHALFKRLWQRIIFMNHLQKSKRSFFPFELFFATFEQKSFAMIIAFDNKSVVVVVVVVVVELSHQCFLI